ncbi:MAG TPA: hypothetical protein VHD62_03090 [Opitutaceae bacterium]|nr:hypothetical protein [Opitutaceae bacterium]
MNDKQTPRSWLLARHAHTAPKLDIARRAAVADAAMNGDSVVIELFRPYRNAWLGLAAIWIALGLFHLTTALVAPKPAPSSIPPALAIAWFAENQFHENFAQIDRLR